MSSNGNNEIGKINHFLNEPLLNFFSVKNSSAAASRVVQITASPRGPCPGVDGGRHTAASIDRVHLQLHRQPGMVQMVIMLSSIQVSGPGWGGLRWRGARRGRSSGPLSQGGHRGPRQKNHRRGFRPFRFQKAD